MTARPDLLEAVKARLDGESEKPLAPMLAGLRPEDVAQLMRELSDREVEEAFHLLDAEDPALASEVLPLLDRNDISRVVDALPDERVADALEDMASDDATYILELMPEDRVEPVVAAMEAPESQEVRERLEYPEGSAGRLMGGEYLTAPADATVAQAIAAVQAAAEDVTIVYVYLVDAAGKLTGVVSLRRLLQVKPDRRLADLSPPNVFSVKVTDDQEQVAQVAGHQDFVALPVVDEENRLVGVITHDDVLDVIREEATEDMLKIAGTSPDDVIALSVWHSARLRMPWLLAAFGMELVAMRVVRGAESRLGDLFVALALFMPAISAMTGNIAVQASTLVVRGLATGRIRRHDSLSVFWRELRTAFIVAVAYGAVLALVAAFAMGRSPAFAAVVGVGLLTSMVLASAFGTLVPIVFHSIKVDPAVATGPLVTTSMDVLAFGTYLTLAAWLLSR